MPREGRGGHRAHARLRHGLYGVCEVCGERIPDDRLRALPATRFCVYDEQRRERSATA